VSDQIRVKDTTLRLVKGDITDLEIDAFVYYAAPDLKLGSGFGTAISVRGGPGIQEELNELAPKQVTEAVVTSAGEMKASFIVHAVGPAFQEDDLENKLRHTIRNTLSAAESKGISAVAFPPMGAGFYGVPLVDSARITVGEIVKYLSNGSSLKEVVICPLDNREYLPCQEELSKITQAPKEATA
jgi:O-acetyl-ADP-ribose deacetylase (regulator of RNase III)